MMKDKLVLITGATDGIGKQTAIQLARMGAGILVHGRNEEKGRRIDQEIVEIANNGGVRFFQADLSSLEQVKILSKELHQHYDHLDVLVNNAGIFSQKRLMSEDGFEMTFAVNHLSFFALTLLVLDLLKKASPSRIINVSSGIHASSIDFDNLQGEKSYSGYRAYSLSKLCNILFTYELAEQLKNAGVTVNCLHPGAINTKLFRTASGGGGAPVSEGAKTPVYLASSPEVNGITGKYFVRSREAKSSSITYNEEVRKRLWRISEELTGIKLYNS